MTKILYYRYFLTYKGEKTEADLYDLLNHIIRLDPKNGEREKTIKRNRVLLHNIISPNINAFQTTKNVDKHIKVLTFSKKRNRNPFLSDIDSDVYKQIPETQKIVELATAVIIPSQRLFLLQRNIHSTSISLIQKYICSFFENKKELKDWGVEFIAINQASDMELIENAKKNLKS